MSEAADAAGPGSTLDLAAYRQRIGDTGPLEASRATLQRLITRHTAAIPFENIEVLAGGVPRLDLAGLQAKLVAQRRGGYCYEQNGLFLAVLRAIGFTVHRLEGRVRAGVPEEVRTARTHFALRVVLDGADHLVDVGFGGLGPTAPIAFAERGPQRDAMEAYRLVDADHGGRMLQLEAPSGWMDCYRLEAFEPEIIDAEAGNWFVATHERAMLRRNLLLGRAVPGARLTLFNRRFTKRRAAHAPVEERLLASRADFAAVLAGEFGLDVPAAALDAVLAAVERQDAAAPSSGSSAGR